MAPQIKEFVEEGLVNIIGGCCGTTPAFIEQYVPLVVESQPHIPVSRPDNLWLSGLDLLEIKSNDFSVNGEGNRTATFTNVGERCNVAGSRKFLRLIKEKTTRKPCS